MFEYIECFRFPIFCTKKVQHVLSSELHGNTFWHISWHNNFVHSMVPLRKKGAWQGVKIWRVVGELDDFEMTFQHRQLVMKIQGNKVHIPSWISLGTQFNIRECHLSRFHGTLINFMPRANTWCERREAISALLFTGTKFAKVFSYPHLDRWRHDDRVHRERQRVDYWSAEAAGPKFDLD